jgi:hypothetical protein
MIKEMPRQHRDAPIDARAQSLGTAMKGYDAYLAVSTNTSCCRPWAMTSASRGSARGNGWSVLIALFRPFPCCTRGRIAALVSKTNNGATSRFAVARGLTLTPADRRVAFWGSLLRPQAERAERRTRDGAGMGLLASAYKRDVKPANPNMR